MKRAILSVLVAAVAVAFVGCKKEETPGTQLDKALNSAKQSADSAAKETDKAAGDLQKKLDGALKK